MILNLIIIVYVHAECNRVVGDYMSFGFDKTTIEYYNSEMGDEI